MKNKTAIYIYSAVILIVSIASFYPEQISGYSPYKMNLTGSVQPGVDHVFGTDLLGRDILSRTIAGGRISLVIGVTARIGSILIGLVIGLLSALSSSRLIINGIVDIFLAIPSLLLAMGLAVVLGEGYVTVTIAIIAGTWAPVARFVDVKITEIKSKDFVQSAKVIGASRYRIVLHYIMPELFPVLVPVLSTGIATSIMMESTLSFLGLGGTSSIFSLPSWGIMIQEGAKFMFDSPWIIIVPSVILTILILCFNQIGDRLTKE